MPSPIRRLTVAQFIDLLHAFPFARAIDAVHVHHTVRPRKRDFRGLATIEAMRRFHMDTNNWTDIAQHLTVDPTGHVWTGRDWNRQPASSSGHNGSPARGPFMIEIVGDFDHGHETLDGPQRAATIDVVAALLRRFELEADAIRFHRELGSPKTCPGSGVDKQALQREVVARLPGLPAASPSVTPSPAQPRLFAIEHVLGREIARAEGAEERADAEVPETELAEREIDRYAREATAERQARQALALTPRAETRAEDPKYEFLRRHLVNLSLGELSEGGLFKMKAGSLEAIVEGIREYARATSRPHVMLYAHGGLVGERDALDYALGTKDWWLAHGVYPVFFVWETDLLELLRQFVIGPRAAPRDVFDFTTDLAIELVAKIPGTAVWAGMKESARRASADDLGDGSSGGARLFAELLVPALKDLEAGGTKVGLHAVAHSAGAILHTHLVPLIHAFGFPVASMSFLAPAIRVDLFEEKLLPLATPDVSGRKAIERFYMLTMEEDAERSDDCWKVYRKSLLYFVSNSFEGLRRKPILGLHESIRKNEGMRAFFGIDKKGRPVTGAAPPGTLYLSYAKGNDPSDLTRAVSHGCFDNDRYSMSTVLRRVLGTGDDPPRGRDDFPAEFARTCDAERRVWPVDPWPARPVVTARTATRSPGDAWGAEGRRRALCVGIDRYLQRPLAGCVADSRLWGRTLEALGFEVNALFDEAATRDAIVAALQDLVDGLRPGDVAVFQYAGHGSQIADDDGDETDTYDEVFVPVDYHTGALLLDDDVADVLERLARGALVTLFMDCCHSGTNSRFAPAMRPLVTGRERVRFLPLDADVQAAHRAMRRRSRATPRSAIEKSVPGVVHFAACQDNEYAWETAGQGDFTAAAAPRLASAVERRETNEAFLEAVRRTVAARGRQHPQLMPPDDELDRHELLAPPGPAVSPAAPPRPAPTDVAGADPDDLVHHVEAIARLLRRRTGHGA